MAIEKTTSPPGDVASLQVNRDWHRLSAADVMAQLATSRGGLSVAEARRRLLALGPNTLPAGHRRTRLRMFVGQFTDFMISLFTQGLLSNRPLLASVAVTIALLLATLYTPSLNAVFETRPLSAGELALAAGVASIILWAVEAEKWLRRRLTRRPAIQQGSGLVTSALRKER